MKHYGLIGFPLSHSFSKQYFTEKFEKELTLFLQNKLEHEDVTKEKAAAIAAFVLVNLPKSLNDEQLIHILPSLDKEFIELTSLVNAYISAYTYENDKQLEETVHDLMKEGKLDEASSLMKSYFQKRIK